MKNLIDSTVGATLTTSTLGIITVGSIFTAPTLIWNALQLLATV